MSTASTCSGRMKRCTYFRGAGSGECALRRPFRRPQRTQQSWRQQALHRLPGAPEAEAPTNPTQRSTGFDNEHSRSCDTQRQGVGQGKVFTVVQGLTKAVTGVESASQRSGLPRQQQALRCNAFVEAAAFAVQFSQRLCHGLLRL